MIDNSRGRRRIAALAAGALAAGALTMLPGLAGLSTASATATNVAYTCDVQLTGGQAAYGGEKPVTVTIDTNAPASATVGDTFTPTVTGTLTFDSTFASQFGPSPVNRLSVDLDADVTTGGEAGSIDLVSPVWQRGGGIGSPVPTMTLDLSGAWDEISPASAGDLDLEIGDLVGHISMGTTFSPGMTPYVLDCEPDAGAFTVDTVAVALPDTSNYTCDVQLTGGQAAYGGEKRATVALSTNAPVTMETGETVSPTVTGSLTFSDAFASQFGPSPVNRLSVDLDADTTTGAEAGSIDLVSPVWQRGGGIGSPVPTMTLDLSGTWDEIAPTSAGDLDLAIEDLVGHISMGTTFSPGMTPYVLDCAADEPVDLGTIEVTAAPVVDTTNYTCDVQLTGGQAAYGGEKRVTVSLSSNAPETMATGETVSPTVTGTLTFGDEFASQFGPSPVNRISVDLDADTTTGAEAGTIDVVSPVWERGGGIGSPVPPMTLNLSGTWDEISPTEVGDLDLAIEDMVGSISMGTTFSPGMTPYDLDCVADEPIDLGTIEVTQGVEPSPYVDTCHVDMTAAIYPFVDDYPAKVDLSLTAPATGKVGVASSATVGARIEFGPELAAFLRNTPIKKIDLSAAATGKAGAANASVPMSFASWNRVYPVPPVSNPPINDPIVLTGTGTWAVTPTAVGSLPLSIDAVSGGMTLTVTYGDQSTSGTVSCTLGEDGSDAATATMAVSAAPPVPVTPNVTVATAPTVTGAAKVGQNLTVAAAFSPADAAKAYQWLSDGAAISGATAASYTVVPADLGKTLSVKVTATKAGYKTAEATAAAGKVVAGTQAVTGKVKVKGSAKVGKKLTATPGKATGSTVKYQWLLNGKVIKKATGKSLKLAKSFKGKKISVKVSYVRTGYTTVTQNSSALKIKK